MTVKGCCVIYSLFPVNTWVNPVATIGKTKQLRGTTQALSSPTSYACVNVKQQVSILRFLFSSHFQIRTVFQIWTRVWIKKPTQPSKRPTDATVWSVCDCALMHSCGAHDYQICVVFEKFKLNSGGGRKKNPPKRCFSQTQLRSTGPHKPLCNTIGLDSAHKPVDSVNKGDDCGSLFSVTYSTCCMHCYSDAC